VVELVFCATRLAVKMEHVVLLVGLTDPKSEDATFQWLSVLNWRFLLDIINGRTERASTQYPRTVTENKIREIKNLRYNGEQKFTSN
jgi:hypothetical protein